MANFDNAFEIIKKHEGGYVNDPDDAGGQTFMGISQRANPNLEIWNTVNKIASKYKKVSTINKYLYADKKLIAEVKNVYKTKYWDAFKLDDCPIDSLANQIFDSAVNCGISATKKMIGRVLQDSKIV